MTYEKPAGAETVSFGEGKIITNGALVQMKVNAISSGFAFAGITYAYP